MRIIDSRAGLAAEANALQRLADTMGQPFLSSDYLLSAVDAFHDRDRLQVIVCDGPSGASAVAPLVRVRRNLHDVLELIGTPALMDPTGFLYDSRARLHRLVSEVASLGIPVHLRGVATADETLQAIRMVYRGDGGMVLTHHPRVGMHIPIAGTWSGYVRALTPKLRQDLRRFQSRADTFGQSRMEWRAPRPAEVPHLLDTFVELEQSGWKADEPGALARWPAMRAFYEGLAARTARRGTLRIGTLWIGPRVAAMVWALEAYDRLWLLKMAYHDEMARASPGMLLIHDALRYAHDRGLAGFEFLGDAAPWQARWRPSPRRYSSALAVPLTARGLVGLGLNALCGAPRRLWAAGRGLVAAAMPLEDSRDRYVACTTSGQVNPDPRKDGPP